MLFDIGYEGRDAEQLVGTLVGHGVRVLVDVRLTPVSRKPGLSKRLLGERLAAAGVEYRHERLLGNPSDNRAGFATAAGLPAARARFRERLDDGAAEAVERLADLAAREHGAILCVERDRARCHRQVIVEAIQTLRPALVAVQL